jgi:hypothetical protein
VTAFHAFPSLIFFVLLIKDLTEQNEFYGQITPFLDCKPAGFLFHVSMLEEGGVKKLSNLNIASQEKRVN